MMGTKHSDVQLYSYCAKIENSTVGHKLNTVIQSHTLKYYPGISAVSNVGDAIPEEKPRRPVWPDSAPVEKQRNPRTKVPLFSRERKSDCATKINSIVPHIGTTQRALSKTLFCAKISLCIIQTRHKANGIALLCFSCLALEQKISEKTQLQ